MPKRSSKPRDLNQLAKAITEQATGAAAQDPAGPSRKNPAAVELGRLGGLKGGKARAQALSTARLRSIGKQGAAARWGKRTPKRK